MAKKTDSTDTTSTTEPKPRQPRTKKPKLALVKDAAQQPEAPAATPFNPTITMTWEGEPEPCWTGAFDALAEMNALDPTLDEAVLDEMRTGLREHGEYTGGGGAAPVYVLAVVQPEPPAAKPKRTKRAQAAQEPDGAQTATEPSTEPKRGRARKPAAMTLAELSEKFVAALEADGKSDATVGAYKSDLAIAQRVLGGEMAIDAIRPADITRFNESEPVVLSRTGAPKASPTVERTRRVLRLALDHAECEGWIAVTPCGCESAEVEA